MSALRRFDQSRFRRQCRSCSLAGRLRLLCSRRVSIRGRMIRWPACPVPKLGTKSIHNRKVWSTMDAERLWKVQRRCAETD